MKIIKREKNIKGNFIKVDRFHLETEKGEIIDRDCVDKHEGVAAVVYNTTTKQFIFVKQYRIGSQNYQIEITAGIVEHNLSAEETIQKEILEETGYKVDSILKLITYYSSPGYSSEILHIFYAEVSEQISEGGGCANETEYIEVINLSKEEISITKFSDGKTLIGLFFLNLI